METAPPPKPGFARLAVLLSKSGLTNADVARATGVDLDHLGPVLIFGHQALVDVAAAHCEAACEALNALGPVQVVSAADVTTTWLWLRLEVGRNHGLTLAHLRKVLDRNGAGDLGRIHVNNSHSLVGIREDRITDLIAALADQVINGIRVRPSQVAEGAIRESAAFTPKASGGSGTPLRRTSRKRPF
ncbi:MAG: DbpA RNA binding domain-containing protein [Planctomycetota bacterium]|jgi:hypothetical protein